mgnify:CR=1 FL=1
MSDDLLICSLSIALALKVTTRLGGIGTGSPVRGLRPGRPDLERISKLPKPESLTSLPSTSCEEINSKKASIYSLASRLFKPSCSNSISESWALVRAGVSSESKEISMKKLLPPMGNHLHYACRDSDYASK